MTNRNDVVDSSKRNALKLIAGSAGAAASLASIPSIANTAGPQTLNQPGPYQRADIEATLVSIPGTTNETLLLKNTTANPLTISRFANAKVTFDDETIDLGAACDNTNIIFPAHEDVMLHFSSEPSEQSHTDTGLNVQASISRLPEGTRVIPLRARMIGTSAVLTHT